MRLIDRLFLWSLVSLYLVLKVFREVISGFPDAIMMCISTIFMAIPLAFIIIYPILAFNVTAISPEKESEGKE